MKFATATQIAIMAVVVCIGLFGLDYWKNPQLWHADKVAAATPEQGVRLTLSMNQLRCEECFDTVRQALATVPGIDAASATTEKKLESKDEAAKMTQPMADYGNKVIVPITDPAKLDFVTLDHALRERGFSAERMEVSGIEHFRLEALLPYLCPGSCERATRTQMETLKARGMNGQFTWLDSIDVNPEKKSVVAFARYLEPGKTVDVTEFETALAHVGYAPNSVRLFPGDDMNHPTGAHAGMSDAGTSNTNHDNGDASHADHDHPAH